ncbi:MAG: glycosyltransferase family 4 protein [Methylicorpusculum sp.]|uniref:glycosyltransferase family 4 protein n=1 Tax=Methylicorpusculum sp. TaxID=2713644 RepID=UPI0027231451|nr:glycosyltransferase family 4 protein [Methylicorpusculum sp.]MDO8938538.1 glycosyltransferase family 4 protein [Methylicorpusculum sp.]MDP2202088.1 glycosyltransferase family 4 protein [Methylicorpusculum sp.]
MQEHSNGTSQLKPIFGINVIGYVSSNLSLGITARHFIKLFIEKGIPVSVFDIDYQSAPNAKSNEYEALTIKPGTELPYSINIFFIALRNLPALFLNQKPGIFSQERLNVGLIWCEETALPKRCCEALRLFDVILTGSHFVRQVYDTNISDILTVPCIHPLFLPSNISPDRDRFGLPKDRLLFVSSFDPHSDPARKNPFGAIDAFMTAFPECPNDNEQPHLIIKLNNAEVKSSTSDPLVLVNKLKIHCSNNPRIHFIAKSLSYTDVLSLYASCDVFVSMHRAEGLGLGLLECMALGKPVIATAWSGNMSFMKHTNSCLVGYDLVPYSALDANNPDKLGKKALWAEPHIDEAVDWMKKLASDDLLRRRIGEQASIDARTYHEAAERIEFMDELIVILEEKKFMKRRQNEKVKNLSALRQAQQDFIYYGWDGVKRRIEDVLNRHLLWRYKKP